MLVEKIGVPAMLEQTAEECIELAHACLKLARDVRGDNPTFKDKEQLINNISEEVADVMICILELGCEDAEIKKWKDMKTERIKKRFSDQEEEQ